MELWIPLTIAAAFFQNIRSAMQKHLKGKLSTLGAAYVRFVIRLADCTDLFFRRDLYRRAAATRFFMPIFCSMHCSAVFAR